PCTNGASSPLPRRTRMTVQFVAPALPPPSPRASADDEFQDLLELLLEYRAVPDEESYRVAYWIASAAMGENHLWQDMKLPNREALSRLLAEYFPALAAKNVHNMKWKKFFYRELCARAEVLICKSPHCAACDDYAVCFGPET
ncbi:MAG: nitrogen fixation protein NifQ, partial [Rhodocyclaceae bacterium]|nr:nitrogen fixation protein NifQ [Rhodocyclaceae bacterium]